MKPCEKCRQQNPDDARFCLQCGTPFSLLQATDQAAPVEPSDTSAAPEERDLWRAFIGPHKAVLFSWQKGWYWDYPHQYYLDKFQAFMGRPGPRFALTWHWPAFLLDPFLWFLYRKMYLYALLYAVGPVVSAFLTGDLTVGIVWRIMAGASANYIYFWHIKEKVAEIHKTLPTDHEGLEEQIRDQGGAQPYVIWLGILLHVLMLGVVVEVMRQGQPADGPFRPEKPRPAIHRLDAPPATS